MTNETKNMQNVNKNTQEKYKRNKPLEKQIARGLGSNPAIIVINILCDLGVMALAIFMSFALDELVTSAEVGVSLTVVIGAIGAAVCYCLINFGLNNFVYQIRQQDSLKKTENRVFGLLMKNRKYTSAAPVGDTSALVTESGIDTYASIGIANIVFYFIMLAACVGLFFFVSWKMALVVLGFYIGYLILSIVGNNLGVGLCAKASKARGKERNVALKGFENKTVLNMLGKEDYYCDKYARELNNARKAYGKALPFTSAIPSLLRLLVSELLPLTVIGAGAFWLASGELSIGDIMLFNVINGELFWILNVMSIAISARLDYQKGMHRVVPIAETQDGSKTTDKIQTIDVSLDKFSFDDKVLFDNFTLELTPGENVCISGESGCGKSTLLKLIANQEDAGSSGAVTVNGINVCDLVSEKYSERLLYAEQTDAVFEDGLRENICMGADYSDDEVAEVIDTCCLTDFTSERGIDAQVSENGGNMSVGQRQRVNVARMLIRKPEFLLLDEPTSALDPETAAAFIQNLKTYGKKHGVTYVAVSHKDDILPLCDRVFRLNAD